MYYVVFTPRKFECFRILLLDELSDRLGLIILDFDRIECFDILRDVDDISTKLRSQFLALEMVRSL
jgi:hypothetical protein